MEHVKRRYGGSTYYTFFLVFSAQASPEKTAAEPKKIGSMTGLDVAAAGGNVISSPPPPPLVADKQTTRPVAQAKNSIELVGHSSPRSKPRGVRKKWGFHFGGSKSGSLKSIKSNRSAEGGGGSDDKVKL